MTRRGVQSNAMLAKRLPSPLAEDSSRAPKSSAHASAPPAAPHPPARPATAVTAVGESGGEGVGGKPPVPPVTPVAAHVPSSQMGPRRRQNSGGAVQNKLALPSFPSIHTPGGLVWVSERG